MTPQELDRYVASYIDGNKESFDTIYLETKKSVYLSIYTIIKNKDTISDLMQDTYMKAIDNIDRYKPNTNFNAWISTIARNIAINYYNKYKRETLISEEDEYLLKDENTNNIINDALNILKDEKEKEIFFLHIVLKTKFKDIAQQLNLPLSTVFYIYKNAIQKIKKEL